MTRSGTTSAGLGRRFEGAVLDWRVAERSDLRRLRRLVESLCASGFGLAIVGAARLSDVDPRLGARPDGPGALFLCPNPGTDAFRVGAEGPEPVDAGTDEPDAVRRALAQLVRRGIGSNDVLLADGEQGPDSLLRILDDQLVRRARRELPVVDPDPEWTLAIDGVHPTLERAHESLLTLADGRIGTRGSVGAGHPAGEPRVLVAGVYGGSGSESRLLDGPLWAGLPDNSFPGGSVRRVLDLRTGVLFEESLIDSGPVSKSARFSSVARPGTVALRAEGTWRPDGRAPLRLPRGKKRVRTGESGRRHWAQVEAVRGGGVTAAAVDYATGNHTSRLDRLGAYVTDPETLPAPDEALARLGEAEAAGFDGLLAEHRRSWAERWEDADVRVEGDPRLQLAVRLGLFHLLASVSEQGETALGARGLSGHGYRGHVFWDTEIYVLPFLAATRPHAARTILEYRIKRLPAALTAARRAGFAGARFPWESARSGLDVTPTITRLRTGETTPVRTGELEEHVVADVAWGAACYVDWTGDEEFRDGPGLMLLVETARYWASRIRLDGEGRGHVDGVIGPDEYHEEVDDNAFTNVMARWNLRRAAAEAARAGGGDIDDGERERWLGLADSLVDGYDAETGVYEQFAGFLDLEPLVIAQLAPRRPVAAEALVGRERLQASQVVKQADVLMLHQLVPDEVEPDSLVPNLRFYEPRTAHGSSLSPAMHASLFARAGLLDEAVEALELASRIDLDDLTQTTAAGLHIATMGGLWQALAFGFLGLRPAGDALRVDPRLPGSWHALELRCRFRGARVVVRNEPGALTLSADPATRFLVGSRSTPRVAGPGGLRLSRRGNTWKEERQ